MPGRPRKERREPGEQRKGTKLSRHGTIMTCRICGSDKHNARRCPNNPEKGKQNVMRKRMQTAPPVVAVATETAKVDHFLHNCFRV